MKYSLILVLTLFFLSLAFLLAPIYSLDANFTNSTIVANISTNCNAPSNLSVVQTNFSAGTDNIIIVAAQIGSPEAGLEEISANRLRVDRDGGNIGNNSIRAPVAGVSSRNFMNMLAVDRNIPASPNYTVTICSNADTVLAQGKVLVLNDYEFYENMSAQNFTVVPAGVILANVSTALPAGNNLILATVEFGSLSAAATDPRVTNNNLNVTRSGNLIWGNPAVLGTTNAASDTTTSIFIIAQDLNAPANASYNITVANSTTGTIIASARMVVFQPNFTFANVTNISVSALGSTLIGNISTTYPENSSIAVLANTIFEDRDGAQESIAIDNYNLTPAETKNFVSSNAETMRTETPGPSGDGSITAPTLLWTNKSTKANPSFNLSAATSATQWNAHSYMVVILLNPPAGNTCTPPTNTNWTIEASDNCVISGQIVNITNLTIRGNSGYVKFIHSNVTITSPACTLNSLYTVVPNSGQIIMVTREPVTRFIQRC